MFVLLAFANECGWAGAIAAEGAGGEVAWTGGDASRRHAVLRFDMNCAYGAARPRGKAGAIEADGADGFCSQVRPATCRKNASTSY